LQGESHPSSSTSVWNRSRNNCRQLTAFPRQHSVQLPGQKRYSSRHGIPPRHVASPVEHCAAATPDANAASVAGFTVFLESLRGARAVAIPITAEAQRRLEAHCTRMKRGLCRSSFASSSGFDPSKSLMELDIHGSRSPPLQLPFTPNRRLGISSPSRTFSEASQTSRLASRCRAATLIASPPSEGLVLWLKNAGSALIYKQRCASCRTVPGAFSSLR
jgi:hypothetical protein